MLGWAAAGCRPSYASLVAAEAMRGVPREAAEAMLGVPREAAEAMRGVPREARERHRRNAPALASA